MTELNNSSPSSARRIKAVNPYQFSIGDTSEFPEYTTGGRYRQVKQPVSMTFQPLATQLADPTIEFAPDMAKFDGPNQQHWWWQVSDRLVILVVITASFLLSFLYDSPGHYG